MYKHINLKKKFYSSNDIKPILDDLTEIYNVHNYFYNRENDQNLRELIEKIYNSISKLKDNL